MELSGQPTNKKSNKMNDIIIKDKQVLESKIISIKKAGLDNLHVLADFDRTLTKAFVNGREVPSLISILRDQNYLTPDYPTKAKELYKKYSSIYNNPGISQKEKKQAMHEWWSKHFELLIKSGLTKNDITKAMTTGNIELRDGADEFLKMLNEKNIPLVILSSSSDYSINILLKYNKLLYKNIHIISNKYEWDNEGRAISINQPIIHGMNKGETMIKNLPIYKDIKNRRNVILLGDSQDDVKMITGFEYDNLLSVGFLNKDTDKYLDEYKKHFDVIITNDGSMDFLNNLLTKIS